MKKKSVKKEKAVAKKLWICRGCEGLHGRDLICPRVLFLNGKKVRIPIECPLCSEEMSKFRPDMSKANSIAEADGKKRFPRTLTSTPEQKEIVELINNRTADFGCMGSVQEIHVGPIVTEFAFAPDKYTRIRKLRSLDEDLAMALSVDSVTVTRIPGKPQMSICIPNKDRKEVSYDLCLKAAIAQRDKMSLPICLGVDTTGQPYVEDLADMPHLLIAGSTGSGKSVFLNNFMTTMLWMKTPKELQFILIDPKSVELFPYKNIPHLWNGLKPTNTVFYAIKYMDDLIEEMKRRTSMLEVHKAKNIKEYNDRVKAEAKALREAGSEMKAEEREADAWPYIVMVIDEIGDLIIAEKKLMTERLAQIAAMARAAGIHVVAATQRPSVDVLSGRIKINFPARIAFKVTSRGDSVTILGGKGAEGLLGKGDMFYMSPKRAGNTKEGFNRIHAPHVKSDDINRLITLSNEQHITSAPVDRLEETVSPVVVGKSTAKAQKALVN